MARYSVNGPAHRSLVFLSTGPATLEQIRDHSGAIGSERKALWWVVKALLKDGLVTSRGGLYRLTGRGDEALTSLRLGQPYGGEEAQPSVRLFVSKVAA
jgi:hypothetical protein